MFRLLNFLNFIVIGSLLLCISGCGPKMPPDMPKLHPVTITVTYDDGTPVDDATIVFYPAEWSNVGDWFCSAVTDQSGVAAMSTQGKYQGIPAGFFDVTAKKHIQKGAEIVPPIKKNPTREEAEAWQKLKANSKQGERYTNIELVYMQQKTTPLKQIEVKPGRNNLILKVGPKIDVLDKPRR
ncbi:MAG: hypothetical protein ACRCUY_07085 [Thermoguttaceae bacterium]